jgi:hypothetical protein
VANGKTGREPSYDYYAYSGIWKVNTMTDAPSREQCIEWLEQGVAAGAEWFNDVDVPAWIEATVAHLRTPNEHGSALAQEAGDVPRMLANLDELKRNTVVSSHRDAIDEIVVHLRSQQPAEPVRKTLVKRGGSFDAETGMKRGDPLYPSHNPLKEYESYGSPTGLTREEDPARNGDTA